MNNKGTTFVLLAILALALWSFSPYLKLFILALLVSLVTQPVLSWFKKKLKSENLAIFATTMSLLLTIILPVGIFMTLAVGQVQSLSDTYQSIDLDKFFNSQSTYIKHFVENTVGVERAKNLFANIETGVVSFVKSTIVPLGTQTLTVALNLFLFIFMFIFVLPSAPKIMETFKNILPMNLQDSEQFTNKLTKSTSTIFSSLVLSAFLQAVATGIIFLIFGVPAAAFLTFTAFFLSFFPFGSGILTVPVGLIYILMGDIFTGLAILIWQGLVISNVDNLVKIKLFSGKEINIPGWLTLLSTLGAVVTFGFWGVIFGPLIAVALLTIIDIYLKDKHLTV